MTDLDIFNTILETLKETYIQKNSDYGNSFEETIKKLGYTAALVRLHDKLNRLTALTTKEQKVKDESIDDTLLDLANYSILTLLYRIKKQNETT